VVAEAVGSPTDPRTPDPRTPDPRTSAGRLAGLARRADAAQHAGSARAVERQHAKGKQTARERIDQLLDEGSFVELDAFTRHRATGFGMEVDHPYGDGVVTGHGTIEGRQVFVYAQDFTVLGGSLGEMHGAKIVKVLDLALRTGRPVIGINDGGGARIQEGVAALAGFGDIFKRNVRASGVIPQISLILGPAAGGAVYSPAITDFVVMAEGTSHMFITGPDVIRAVTGEEVGFDELGGGRTHAMRSGAAQHLADTEADAIDWVRELLSYLPSNNVEDPPVLPGWSDDLEIDEADLDLDHLIPDSPTQPYDMRDVLAAVLDDAEFLEVHAMFAPNILCGFGRVEGATVGVVANQPMRMAGVLDIASSQKGARFVRFCDAFNIPVLTFVDVPGFLPGTEQEWNGIIRHGAKLLYAYAEATVPLITVITRKAYGGAYIVMGSKHLGADVNLAWPSAQVAVMGAQGAVGILNRRDIAAAEDAEAARAQLVDGYERAFDNPWIAAERGYLDAVIAPSETRGQITRSLRMLRSKSVAGPARKHGNIPL
jgi:propionyl-CoA carboxylase beta chain